MCPYINAWPIIWPYNPATTNHNQQHGHTSLFIAALYIIAPNPPPLLLTSSVANLIMARGQSYILSKRDEITLRQIDPQHSRIKRSDATKLAVDQIGSQFVQPTDGTPITINKTPPFVRTIASIFNHRYLRGEHKNRQLDARNLWRIYFRNTFGVVNTVKTKDQSLSHRAIYIQRRHNVGSDLESGYQKRIKSTTTVPIGSDYSTICNITTIDQTGSSRLIYTCNDLHARHHGSIHQRDIQNHDLIHQHVGISSKIISIYTTGASFVAKHNDVTVAFDGAAFFKTLRKDMFQYDKSDLPKFEESLGRQLLQLGKTRDIGRCNGSLDATKDSANVRIRFGFGRIQRQSYKTNIIINGTTFPGANVEPFLLLPSSLKDRLSILFNNSTAFTQLCLKNSFPNKDRNQNCAGHLNKLMGYPQSTSLFEYYDVVISRNVVLRKHCDSKNDHRPGYNLCSVYSYFTTIDRKEYKVSVIMTTRYTVGSAFCNTCDNARVNNLISRRC